jgi:hypothetical protein
MHANRRRVVTLRAVVCGLLVVWVVGSPRPAWAFSCPPPTPWYVETITVRPPGLPAGVRIWDALDGTGGSSIYVKNATQSPLYLFGRRPVLLERDLPNIAVNRVTAPPDMAVLDQIFPTRRLSWSVDTWVERRFDPDKPGHVLATDMMHRYVAGWEKRSLGQGVRPDDAAPPGPQHGQLDLFYQGHQIAVPFTSTYHVNPKYDPERPYPECPGPNFSLPGLLTLALVVGLSALNSEPVSRFFSLIALAVSILALVILGELVIGRAVRAMRARRRR